MEDKKTKVNRPVRVGVLGLGTVGSGVVTVLTENKDIINARSTDILLTHIADKDVEKAQRLADQLHLNYLTIENDWQALVYNDDIDILVEVAGGIEMPKQAITAALEQGKSVVTANKDLLASYGSELLNIAEEHHTDLFFEASVAGGIPIIQVMKESLAANKFHQVMGILNGTTNYILTAMSERGLDFAEALAEAKELGYAEADPTNDVEGYDAARKIAILASIAFNSRVTDSMVSVEGITRISQWDITYAKEFGYEIKMVAIAKEDGDSIEVRVHPLMLSKSHPLATIRDSYNAVFVEGYPIDKAMFYGRGAGSLPTASAVVGDIINAARNIRFGSRSRWGCTCYQNKRVKSLDETVGKYYVRILASDRPGVFAAITKVLGQEQVSMDAVMQKRRISDKEAEIVLITHQVRHANIIRAMNLIGELDCVVNVDNIIRVEEFLS